MELHIAIVLVILMIFIGVLCILLLNSYDDNDELSSKNEKLVEKYNELCQKYNKALSNWDQLDNILCDILTQSTK